MIIIVAFIISKTWECLTFFCVYICDSMWSIWVAATLLRFVFISCIYVYCRWRSIF